MLDEMMKALGPWPLMQVMFGALILGVGVFAIVRGSQKNTRDGGTQMEDKRAEWEAYTQLRNIEQNTYHMVRILESISSRIDNNADAMKALASQIYNYWGGPGPGKR